MSDVNFSFSVLRVLQIRCDLTRTQWLLSSIACVLMTLVPSLAWPAEPAIEEKSLYLGRVSGQNFLSFAEPERRFIQAMGIGGSLRYRLQPALARNIRIPAELEKRFGTSGHDERSIA